jgi:predicted GIY-YIG superfamily endonuclease
MITHAGRIYSVYFLRCEKSLEVKYVGMTHDVQIRRNSHRQKYGKKHIFIVVFDGLTVEQALRCESFLVRAHESAGRVMWGTAKATSSKTNSDVQMLMAVAALPHIRKSGLQSLARKVAEELAKRNEIACK